MNRKFSNFFEGTPLANLPRRISLTLRHHGLAGFARKSVRFMLRLTPLRRYLVDGSAMHEARVRSRRWYRRNWKPVTVIVPTYGDPSETIRAVRNIRRTTDRARVQVVAVDDGSTPEFQQALRKEADCEVVLGAENLGFARNVNRVLGPIARDTPRDVVIMNSDVVAHRGWLPALQHAAYQQQSTAIVGPKLLYPDRRIQSAGSYRNIGAPEWFDHRYRFKPADYGPADVPVPCVGVTGACMYVRGDALAELGALDDHYGMAFEDMDYCLRAWEAGRSVIYHPAAVLSHLESHTRGSSQGERELASQAYFWQRWGDWFDSRRVRTVDGRLRVIYVTEDTGVGGGHREIFEQINRLVALGHEVSLHTLGEGPPHWFDLKAPVLTFRSYDELRRDLAQRDTIRVATWWATSRAVWLASVQRGIPVYFVQDIETSYYPDDPRAGDTVMASYREEFHYMTTSKWNQDRLLEMGLKSGLTPAGVDRQTFRPLEQVQRKSDVILAVGRSHHLKNLDLTVRAWQQLPEPRPELWLYGIEPELGPRYGARYITAPSDEELNALLNQATLFVQTSRHEGFCLPVLEAMGAGTPTVTTDSHGNREYCKADVNCLMPDADASSVRDALRRALVDVDLRIRLREEGLKTAARYDREASGAALDVALQSVAAQHEPNSKIFGRPRRAAMKQPATEPDQDQKEEKRDQQPA